MSQDSMKADEALDADDAFEVDDALDADEAFEHASEPPTTLASIDTELAQLQNEHSRLSALITQDPYPSMPVDVRDGSASPAVIDAWHRGWEQSNEVKLEDVAMQIGQLEIQRHELEESQLGDDERNRRTAPVQHAVFTTTEALCAGKENRILETEKAIKYDQEHSLSFNSKYPSDKYPVRQFTLDEEARSYGQAAHVGQPDALRNFLADDYLADRPDGAQHAIGELFKEGAIIVKPGGAFTQEHAKALIDRLYFKENTTADRNPATGEYLIPEVLQIESQAAEISAIPAYENALKVLAAEARKGNVTLKESEEYRLCARYTAWQKSGAYDKLTDYINAELQRAQGGAKSAPADGKGHQITLVGDQVPGEVLMLFASRKDAEHHLPNAQEAVDRFNALQTGGKVSLVSTGQDNRYALRHTGDVDNTALFHFMDHTLNGTTPTAEAQRLPAGKQAAPSLPSH